MDETMQNPKTEGASRRVTSEHPEWNGAKRREVWWPVGALIVVLSMAAAFLVMAGAANAQLQAEWDKQIISGQVGGDMARLDVAGQDGLIGIAFERITTTDVGFAIGDYETGFAVKTLDIAVADTLISFPSLAKVSDTTWLIVAKVTATEFKVWKTTDSGATWAEKLVQTVGSGGNPTTVQIVADSDDPEIIWLAWDNAIAGSTHTPNVARSDDAGEAWTITLAPPTVSSLQTPMALAAHGGTVTIFATAGTNPASAKLSWTDTADGYYWSTWTDGLGIGIQSSSPLQYAFNGQYALAVVYADDSSAKFYNRLPTPEIAGEVTQLGAAQYSAAGTTTNCAIAGNVAGHYLYVDGTLAPKLWYGYTTLGPTYDFVTPTEQTEVLDADDNTACAAVTNDRAYAIFSSSGIGGRLEVWSAALPAAAAVQYLAIPDLTGFDVSSFADTMVVRAGDPVSEIKTIDVGSMTQIAEEESTCGPRVDGVLAYQIPSGSRHIGYVSCTGDGSETDSLFIRNVYFDAPDVTGTACANSNFCTFNLIPEGITGVSCPSPSVDNTFSTFVGQIGSVQGIAIDHSRSGGRDPLLGPAGYNIAAVGFAYHNIDNGKLGVFVDLLVDDDEDISCIVETDFVTPGGTARICAWRNSATNRDYIIGAGTDGGSRVWEIAIQPNFGAAIREAPQIIIQITKSFTGEYSTLLSAACARDYVLVHTVSGQIARINPFQPGAFVEWVRPGGLGYAGSLATSQDGLWGSYLTADTINVFDARTGTLTCGGVERPTGAFRYLEMSQTGQYVFYVTDAGIYKIDVQTANCTTEEVVPSGSICTVILSGDACEVSETNCADPLNECTQVNPDGTPQVPIAEQDDDVPGLSFGPGDGMCIVCSWINGDGFTIMDKTGATVMGFLLVGGSVIASLVLAKRKGVSISPGTNAMIGGVGMGAAYVLFLFPLFIILLCAALAAAVIAIKAKGSGA